MQKLRIIFPSSLCKASHLIESIKNLNSAGFQVDYKLPKQDNTSPYLSASIETRLKELSDALLSDSQDPILCARGGYGASDLLPLLPWAKLKKVSPKFLVGFSDISALQSALFSKLGWPSIHGPMPGSSLWGKNGEADIKALYQLLLHRKVPLRGALKIKAVTTKQLKTKEAWLFGGCMSVLCNLIGTPYFPHSLRGALLFLEDTEETPGRIFRMLNQLNMCGILDNASGLLLGNFGDEEVFQKISSNIAKRVSIPVFTSEGFGHISPNYPLVLGAKARIAGSQLRWSYKEST
jgi:muramoyltetrapeptide carboxypeptidase